MDYAIGDSVDVTIDAVPERDFEGLKIRGGKIIAVNNQPNNPSDKKLYQVEGENRRVFCRYSQLKKTAGESKTGGET